MWHLIYHKIYMKPPWRQGKSLPLYDALKQVDRTSSWIWRMPLSSPGQAKNGRSDSGVMLSTKLIQDHESTHAHIKGPIEEPALLAQPQIKTSSQPPWGNKKVILTTATHHSNTSFTLHNNFQTSVPDTPVNSQTGCGLQKYSKKYSEFKGSTLNHYLA